MPKRRRGESRRLERGAAGRSALGRALGRPVHFCLELQQGRMFARVVVILLQIAEEPELGQSVNDTGFVETPQRSPAAHEAGRHRQHARPPVMGIPRPLMCRLRHRAAQWRRAPCLPPSPRPAGHWSKNLWRFFIDPGRRPCSDARNSRRSRATRPGVLPDADVNAANPKFLGGRRVRGGW